jgi:hypothetical protein
MQRIVERARSLLALFSRVGQRTLVPKIGFLGAKKRVARHRTAPKIATR